jgi:4-hydroxy-4-methyl-2-oxoglutarate aldolase
MEDPVIRLKRLDACAVSDAMDKLALAGAVGGLEQRAGSGRIAGRVMTFRLVPHGQAPAGNGPVRHLGTTAIERAEAGDVIVVEQRTGIEAGSWGGILTLGAKVKGIAGVVSDGLVRDLDEADAYDFPVFSRGGTTRTARGRVQEADTGEPVTIGDVRVRSGDYVIADRSGVVFVPAADIHRVLEAAEMIFAREAAMAGALQAGGAITEVMGANYENMLKASLDAGEGGNT